MRDNHTATRAGEETAASSGRTYGRLRLSVGLLAAVFLAGCQPEASEDTGGQGEVRAVWVEPVESAAARILAYSGTVRARFEVPLAFRTGGKIAERFVDPGTSVRAGDVIARLDATDLESSLRAEKARERAAETEARRSAEDLTRVAALKDKGHVSESALDRAEATADAARETLKAAREARILAESRLSYAVLRADADGVVTEVRAEPGEVVTAGQPVALVTRGSAREIEVAIPEARIADLDRATARVSLWAAPGRSFPATLREVSPQADSASRSFTARYALDAPIAAVRLGMTATVALSPEAAHEGLSVPLSAVWYEGGAARVWRAEADARRVSAVPVTVRRIESERAVIAGDLAVGDDVVSMGVHRLDPGLEVRVVQRAASGTTAAGATSSGALAVGALQ
ncbi:efflux RND transporter periplasmic adaptor subunit [Stappia sp. ICDLI1TA098]|jgi:RND family efflux transporter MFP subunit